MIRILLAEDQCSTRHLAIGRCRTADRGQVVEGQYRSQGPGVPDSMRLRWLAGVREGNLGRRAHGNADREESHALIISPCLEQ